LNLQAKIDRVGTFTNVDRTDEGIRPTGSHKKPIASP